MRHTKAKIKVGKKTRKKMRGGAAGQLAKIELDIVDLKSKIDTIVIAIRKHKLRLEEPQIKTNEKAVILITNEIARKKKEIERMKDEIQLLEISKSKTASAGPGGGGGRPGASAVPASGRPGASPDPGGGGRWPAASSGSASGRSGASADPGGGGRWPAASSSSASGQPGASSAGPGGDGLPFRPFSRATPPPYYDPLKDFFKDGVATPEYTKIKTTEYTNGKDFMEDLSKLYKVPLKPQDKACGAKLINFRFFLEFLGLENYRNSDRGGAASIVRGHYQKTAADKMANDASKLPYLPIIAEKIFGKPLKVTRPVEEGGEEVFCMDFETNLKTGEPFVPHRIIPVKKKLTSSEFIAAHGPPIKIGALFAIFSRILAQDEKCKKFLGIIENYASIEISTPQVNKFEDYYTYPLNGPALLLHFMKLDCLDQLYPGLLRCLCDVITNHGQAIIHDIIMFDAIFTVIETREEECDEPPTQPRRSAGSHSLVPNFAPSKLAQHPPVETGGHNSGSAYQALCSIKGRTVLYDGVAADVWFDLASRRNPRDSPDTTLLEQIDSLRILITTDPETMPIFNRLIGKDFSIPDDFKQAFVDKNQRLSVKLRIKETGEKKQKLGISEYEFRDKNKRLMDEIKRTEKWKTGRDLFGTVSRISSEVTTLLRKFIRKHSDGSRPDLSHGRYVHDYLNARVPSLIQSLQTSSRRKQEVYGNKRSEEPRTESSGKMYVNAAENENSGTEYQQEHDVELKGYEFEVGKKIKEITGGTNTSGNMIEQIRAVQKDLQDGTLVEITEEGQGLGYYIKSLPKLRFNQKKMEKTRIDKLMASLNEMKQKYPKKGKKWTVPADVYDTVVKRCYPRFKDKEISGVTVSIGLKDVLSTISLCLDHQGLQQELQTSSNNEKLKKSIVYIIIMDAFPTKCGIYQYTMMKIVLECLEFANEHRKKRASEREVRLSAILESNGE